MADTYVKNIEGHKVKDEEARNSIIAMQETIAGQTQTINNQTTKLNEHTTKLVELEALSHLKPVYDSSTESITFQ